MTAIRRTATVKPGGVIEVRAPELREGTQADVIVLVDSPASGVASATPRASTWAELMGSAGRPSKSVGEIDRYVRELRDEWDR